MSEDYFCFTIPGVPSPQKRHRHFSVGKGTRTYDPSAKEKMSFLQHAQSCCPDMHPLQGALKVEIHFTFPRPDSHLKKDGSLRKGKPKEMVYRPDLDNLTKLVKDAINGHAYKDDSQVIDLHVTKSWSSTDKQGSTRVGVYALEPQTFI